MTWTWFGGTRSLSSEPPALGGRKGSDQAWCCFMKKYRDCSKVTTAKCSTHLPWSRLFIHSCRQERSKGRFKPARREQKGSHGCGQRQALKSRETPIPLCCNSGLFTDKLHQSQLATLGPLPPSAGTCQQWRNDASLFPPAASVPRKTSSSDFPPRNIRWAPLHLCNIRCSRYPKAPAHFSGALG